MATYNLHISGLDKLLDSSVSNATENAIIKALLDSDPFQKQHGTIGVDVESQGGAYSIGSDYKLFLDVGSSNSMTLTSPGGVVIAAGDGGNTIIDQGPGGDTLIGGAGADKLQVTSGDNVLIGNGSLTTVAGGTGHDFMSGGAMLLHWSHFDDGRGQGNGNGGDHSDDHKHDGDHEGQTFQADTLIGGSGNDTFLAYHGNNVIYAGSGNDTIIAGDGSNTIYGPTMAGATNAVDTIYLGSGDTSIVGGVAGQAMIYAGMHGDDTILGSSPGQTLTVYSDQSSNNVASTSVNGGITTITFKDHQSLSLDNLTIHFSNGGKLSV